MREKTALKEVNYPSMRGNYHSMWGNWCRDFKAGKETILPPTSAK